MKQFRSCRNRQPATDKNRKKSRADSKEHCYLPEYALVSDHALHRAVCPQIPVEAVAVVLAGASASLKVHQ